MASIIWKITSNTPEPTPETDSRSCSAAEMFTPEDSWMDWLTLFIRFRT